MTIDVSNQAFTFLLSILLGVALGVLYDVFKVLRLVGLNGKIVVFFEDILFFLIAAISMFSFYMQQTQGKARIYPVIAALIGFWIYFKTVEKAVFWIVKTVYKGVVDLFKILYKNLLKKPARFVLKLVIKALRPVIKFVHEKITRNIIIFFKNLLQKKGKVLYNNKRISKKGKVKRRYEQKNREKAEERQKVFVF